MNRWKLVLLALAVDIFLSVILNIVAGGKPLQDLFWAYPWLGIVVLVAHIWLVLRLSVQEHAVTAEVPTISVPIHKGQATSQSAFPWWGWLCGFLILFPLDLIPDIFIGAGQLDDGGYIIGFCMACMKCVKCWLARWF